MWSRLFADKCDLAYHSEPIRHEERGEEQTFLDGCHPDRTSTRTQLSSFASGRTLRSLGGWDSTGSPIFRVLCGSRGCFDCVGLSFGQFHFAQHDRASRGARRLRSLSQSRYAREKLRKGWICGTAENAKDGAPSPDLRGLPDGALLDIDGHGVPRLRVTVLRTLTLRSG